jgi:hypothetical protein
MDTSDWLCGLCILIRKPASPFRRARGYTELLAGRRESALATAEISGGNKLAWGLS